MKNFIKNLIGIITCMMMITISCSKPEVNPETHEKPIDTTVSIPEIKLQDEGMTIVYPEAANIIAERRFRIYPANKGTEVIMKLPEGLNATMEYNDNTGEGVIVYKSASETFEAGYVTICANNETGQTTIRLYAEKAYINVSQSEFNAGHDEYENTFFVNANIEYEYNCQDEWIESLERNDNSFHFKISANNSLEQRIGEIILTDKTGFIKSSVKINQYPVENPFMLMNDYQLLVSMIHSMGLKENYDSFSPEFQFFLDAAGWTSLPEELPTNGTLLPNGIGGIVQNGQLIITYININFYQINTENFTTTIPEEIGYFKNLNELYLEGIPGLCGTIPESFRGLKSLNFMVISDTALEGTIPEWMANLPNLNTLILVNNNLSGNIPESFTEPKVKNFRFYGNRLNGQIPLEMTETEWWNFETENFEGLKNGEFCLKKGQQEGYRLWLEGYEDIEKYPFGFPM